MAGYDIKVQNIVATASLGKSIDLEKVIEKIENTEYEPEQFPGIVFRTKDPKAATLIFSSGKVVCTGTSTIKDAKKVVKKVMNLLKKAGISTNKSPKIQIENIVASATLNLKPNLDKIAFELENSEYEPEQFPGLIYRMTENKLVFLVFSSGKIICTGARFTKEVEDAVKEISKRLKKL